MRKFVLAAALVAVAAQQPGWAAEKTKAAKEACYSPSAIEADQAIRFLTNVMVISSTCQDTIYGEFRLRNREPILAYQKTLIAHFHGAPAFDRWNTSLANQAAQKHAGEPSAQVCQQAAELLKQASSLDPPHFRSFAAAQAAAADAQYPKCGKQSADAAQRGASRANATTPAKPAADSNAMNK